MSCRSLITLPFPSEVKRKLLNSGFRTQGEIIEFNATNLSKILRFTIEECDDILKVASADDAAPIKGLEEVLRREFANRQVQKIKTSCLSIDRKLNGGLPIGNVIEIYGTAGSGKTQICYQLCVNVQLPKEMGGLDAEVLYIDTESRFKPERIVQIAQHVFGEKTFDENMFLNRINFVRVLRPEKLKILILYHLENFLKKHAKVKLVILDSVSYQMRFNVGNAPVDYLHRSREIHLMAHRLRTIAHTCNVAVVVTNQVTQNLETGKLQPALGKTWSFTCSTKLFLERVDEEPGTRKITLVKSRLKGPFTTSFKIQVFHCRLLIKCTKLLIYFHNIALWNCTKFT